MRTTNRVISENAKAFIPTSVFWNIPDDGIAYLINVPIENYSDELNFSTNAPGVTLSILSFDKRGVILSIIVPIGTAHGLYDLRVINPDGTDNSDLQDALANNHSARIGISSGPFDVIGNDTIDIYGAIQEVTDIQYNVREVSSNTVLSEDDDVIVATADIVLTLPNSATIGKSFKICANNNTVTVNPGVGGNISGNTTMILRNYDVMDVKYLATNTWLIV